MHGVWELSAVRQVGPPALVDPSPGGTPACGAGAQQVTQNEPSAIFTAAQAVLRYLSLCNTPTKSLFPPICVHARMWT